MNIEIERKFLVQSDAYKTESFKKTYIKQGFLNSNKNRVVRVRLTENSAYLTIKGKSCKDGLSRYEWEKEISKDEANQLFLLCEDGIIEKNRFYVKQNEFVYEIDEFMGDNLGLVVAEIELNSKKDSFFKPVWLGDEVTGDQKYYNSNLSKYPYKNWN